MKEKNFCGSGEDWICNPKKLRHDIPSAGDLHRISLYGSSKYLKLVKVSLLSTRLLKIPVCQPSMDLFHGQPSEHLNRALGNKNSMV